jgi:hypothetical protein
MNSEMVEVITMTMTDKTEMILLNVKTLKGFSFVV